MTDRDLRISEVEKRVGLKRSAIYARIRRGEFPAPIHDGPRCARWPESEIEKYQAARIMARDTANGGRNRSKGGAE